MILTFAEKRLYVHGTSSKFIPTILSQGLIPNPKKKTGVDWETPYEGAYLSLHLNTAAIYAKEAARKHGGDPAYVFAVIETKSPEVVADEDSLNRLLDYGRSADRIINFLQKEYPHVPVRRWEARREDIEAYLRKGRDTDLDRFGPKSEENIVRDKLLKSLKDIVSKSSAIRFKDRAIGFRGSNKIVYIARVVRKGYKDVVVPVYGRSSEAESVLKQEYEGEVAA